MAVGKVIFAEIAKLDDGWETGLPLDDPQNVWKIWNRTDYYLWGANAGNVSGMAIGKQLGGGGMASVNHGPTRGLAHPHYVGIDTMDSNSIKNNHKIYASLASLLLAGNNIVIPIFHDRGTPAGSYKFSLGTGFGSSVPNWNLIQHDLLENIHLLCTKASSVDIPTGVYWPDCRNDDNLPQYPIASIKDIEGLVKMLKPK